MLLQGQARRVNRRAAEYRIDPLLVRIEKSAGTRRYRLGSAQVHLTEARAIESPQARKMAMFSVFWRLHL